MSYSTLELEGKTYVVVPEDAFDKLADSAGEGPPALPEAAPDGSRPAKETLIAMMAQDLFMARKAAGLTQSELAGQAGVRVETISRIETGKHVPSLQTIRKLGRVIDLGE